MTCRPCSVPGCTKQRNYKDYCGAHKMQMIRSGKIVKSESGTNAMTAQQKLEKFSTPEPNTGCWLWVGELNSIGRPRLSRGHGRVSAARVALGLVGAPKWLQANHTCHNSMCVNPRHMYIGTQQDNIRDMIKAGRASWQTKT